MSICVVVNGQRKMFTAQDIVDLPIEEVQSKIKKSKEVDTKKNKSQEDA